MLSIDDVREFPLSLLSDASGRPLTDLLKEDSSYYSLFAKVLNGQREYFSKLLSTIEVSKSNHRLIHDRASIITIMEKLGIDYHHAWGIYPHVKDGLPLMSLEEALNLVLHNYAKILKFEVSTPPILVRIDQNGRARIIEGLHRATISILQNSPTIAAIVVDRDPTWAGFIKLVEGHSEKMYGDANLIYHHIQHPDFVSKRVIREDRTEAFSEILTNDRIHSVVDLGAFYGEMSHAFARKNKEVIAVEYDKEFAEVIEKLSATYCLKVDVKNSEITKFLEDFEGKSDLGIALSIAYHIKRRDPGNYDYFMKRIKEIFKFILIDSENKTEVLDDETLLAEFTGWEYKLIFKGSDMRNIYLFSRIFEL